MNAFQIYEQAQHMAEKYRTRDPFELLNALGVNTAPTDTYARDGLKGYCIVLLKKRFVRYNALLPDEEQRVVVAHEAGHIVLHGNLLRQRQAFHDNDVYGARNQPEREANAFAADFLLEDAEVLDLIHSADATFTSVANSLCIPAPFFAFKLYSMIARGANASLPVELNNTFLAADHKSKGGRHENPLL